MKTKRRIQEKTIDKAFNYLNELHHVLTITDSVNLTKLSTVHKVSKTYGTLLLKNKLLIKTNSGALKWATIEPNRDMAIELVKRANQYQNNSVANKSKKKEQVAIDFTQKQNKVTIHSSEYKPSVVKKNKTFSLLWGVIKFDY